jgi:hypothetical protein
VKLAPPAEEDILYVARPKLLALTIRAALTSRATIEESTELGSGPWRLADIGGYWIVFRFASRGELDLGLERPGLRYVGRILDKDVLADPKAFPEGLPPGFTEQLRHQAGS